MNNYTLGEYNVQCDICGAKRKRSEVRYTWDGYLACTIRGCWYPKHPADEPIPIVTDDVTIPDGRLRPSTLTFTTDQQGISTWGGVIQTSNNWSQTISWAAWDLDWDSNNDFDNTIPLR